MREFMRSIERGAQEAWPRLLAAVLLATALVPLAPLALRAGNASARPAPADAAQGAAEPAAEWPRQIDGAALRPLAVSPLEARFAARFPGRIARFASDDATWVLRDVREPTRMLHPAADCFRGLGWRIQATRLELDGRARRWRCFVAERGGQRVRVCERIEGGDGRDYTDTSAWYWEAVLGRTQGPWRALTRVEML